MLNGTLKRLLPVLISSAFILGCDARSEPKSIATRSMHPVPAAWHEGRLPILQFRKDDARERGWILTREGVLVFDFRKRETVGYVPLPQWLWVGEAFACPPDLAVGPGGEVVVSSNVLPVLWRIDPATLEVSRHELALEDGGRDVGFSTLVYSGKRGAYFGTSKMDGTRWQIEGSLHKARKLSDVPRSSCDE